MNNRAVVIGSGIAGLTAAATLAILGREVTLVERAARPAPLLAGFARGEYYCDVGLHYTGGLEPDGLLSRILDRLGVLDLVEPVALRADGFDRLLWPESDIDIAVPCGLEAAEDALCSAFPASTRAIGAYMGAIRLALARTPLLNPDLPPSDWTPSPHEMISLTDFMSDHGCEPRVTQLLGRYGEVLCGLGPDEAPFSTHTVVVGSYLRSAHGVRGGGRALVAAFSSALERLGVIFRGGCEVREIEVSSDGSVEGVVVADGRRFPAGTVVFTPHPSLLPAMLGPARTRAAYERRLRRCSNTPAMFLAFLDAENDELPDDQNVYVFPPEAEARPDRVLALMAGSPPAPGQRRTRCLIRPATLAELGHPGDAAGRARPAGYQEAKERITAEALARARSHLPGLQAQAVVHETLSPWSFLDWTGTAEGSAYGLKRMVAGYRFRSRTPFEGLFLAGQSLLTPGIMGAAASAIVACCNSDGAERTWQALF